MNGYASGIVALTVPFALFRNTTGYAIAALGVVAAWLWWRPLGCVIDGVLVTRYLFVPKPRRVRLADVQPFELVPLHGSKTWEGAVGASGGVAAVTLAGERIPIVESASWSSAHGERWLRYLQQLHLEARAATSPIRPDAEE